MNPGPGQNPTDAPAARLELRDEVRASLVRMRVLLSDPSHWTTAAEARNALGFECGPRSRFACAWCLSGAIWRVSPYPRRRTPTGLWHVTVRCHVRNTLLEAMRAQWAEEHRVWPWSLAEFNDTTDHATVLRIIDRAFDIAETTPELARVTDNDW